MYGATQGGVPKKDFPRKTDSILRYTRNDNYTFHVEYRPYGKHNTTGRRATDRGGTRKVEYRKEGTPINNWWTDLKPISNWAKERTGYPTQKPLSLLERIIKTSSNEGDNVLDPFCGCATTCVAAERLQRQWIGIDLSSKAVELVKMRLEKELGMFYDVIHRTDIPKRSEKLPNYRTHKHVLFGEQEGLCNGCKTQFPFRNMTIDHVVPQRHGGTHHKDNLQLLCNACNSMKGTGTQAQLIHKLQENGFMHATI